MEKRSSLVTSLSGYVLVGAGAAFLLWLIEIIDLNIQLTPFFESFYERLIFSSSFGLNVIGGSLIGLLVGLAAGFGSWLTAAIRRLTLGQRDPGIIYRFGIYLMLCGVAALLLKQQAHIHGYMLLA